MLQFCTPSRLQGLALTDSHFAFEYCSWVRFVQNVLLAFPVSIQYISLIESFLFLMEKSNHLKGCSGLSVHQCVCIIFRCDSISKHLPLSMGQWVTESVIDSFRWYPISELCKLVCWIDHDLILAQYALVLSKHLKGCGPHLFVCDTFCVSTAKGALRAAKLTGPII